jgi:hypothetical protein
MEVIHGVLDSLWMPGTQEAKKQNLAIIGASVLLILGLLVAIYIAS